MTDRVDFGRTADDYAAFRAGFPDSFYEHLANRGIALKGARIVDLGTGTGTLARGFSTRGARVVGIDPSEPMLAQARSLAARQGLDVEFRASRAEATGLPSASADVIAAGQCWHWFDRPKAAAECMRILKPGGALLIGHFDWIPLPGNVVDATEVLIREHNPKWRFHGGNGVYGPWLTDLGAAGFAAIQSESYDEWPSYSHAAWRGRVRASAGIAATLAPDAVAAFDAAHAQMLAERFPTDPLPVHHRVFIALGRKPSYGSRVDAA